MKDYCPDYKPELTDQQIIEAVLTSCGWLPYYKGTDRIWTKGSKTLSRYKNFVCKRNILTSLDACHEVFEKDAPGDYWRTLYDLCLNRSPLMRVKERYTYDDYSVWLKVSKSKCRPRCLAWLKFKGVEGV